MPFPVSEDDVAAAEQRLGMRFPESYRSAMKLDNGGSICAPPHVISDDEDGDWYDLFKVLDHSDRTRLARTSAMDIVRENEQAREWVGFPDHAIAIGADGGGNYAVMLVTDGMAGPEVYDWFHETAELTLLAADFADLTKD